MIFHLFFVLILQQSFLLLRVSSVAIGPFSDTIAISGCGYSNCPKPDPSKLNIHLVPHTHDDVGWLKTVDQYYYGSNRFEDWAPSGVQYILDSVVRALQMSSDRKFIYVETAFFWKWWNQQSDLTKIVVTNLVQSGQLEFINGGWSMNDEGAAHYNSIIDQMTWGFTKLKDLFGSCGIPKIGWQIDPFGHSREQASLFAQMNFDAFFFTRLDYQDKNYRAEKKTLEFLWSGSNDLGQSSNIFTLIMANDYHGPTGFCYDLPRCNDEPIIDDPQSEEYNADKKAKAFVDWSHEFAAKYATNNIMVMMGEDFTFQSADTWFINMDKLINIIKSNYTNVNIFYSTPSCYLYAIHQSNRTFTVKYDDFFPYQSVPNAYWTGYFTSRPTTKYYERVGNNFLQICKQLDAISLLKGTDDDIGKLRESMGIFQHHDAITGTEKQHVSNDYCRQLSKGITRCESVVQKALSKLIAKDDKTPVPSISYCRLLNISQCAASERNSSFAITIYNPISRPISQHIRIPVSGNGYSVKGPDGNVVKSDLLSIPEYVTTIPERKSQAINELLFTANIPPLGFSTYFVKPNEIVRPLKNFSKRQLKDKVSIKAKSFTINFHPDTGAITDLVLNNGQKIALNQSIQYYKGQKGDNIKNRASGAYIFRPDGQTPINLGNNITAKFVYGKLVTEVRQTYNDWVSQTIRVYPDEDYVEFDWVIGPISIADNIGKEMILLFESDLITNKIFYTDSNGRQIMKRVRNYRDTYPFVITEPVSGNYYPINSRIIIKDQIKGLQLTVVSDRSQGGSSINDGAMELMVHRRCLNDDGYGVNEPLNELGIDRKGLVVKGTHYLFPSKISKAAKLHRDFAQRLYMSPLLTFTNDEDDEQYRKSFRTSYSGLNEELPPNVHLLTLEQWNDGTYLLRLEHFYQLYDDPNGLSKPATVQLQNLFKSFTIVEVSETTLGANQLIGQRQRLQFKTINTIKHIPLTPIDAKNFTITLSSMQIRTFIVSVKSLSNL